MYRRYEPNTNRPPQQQPQSRRTPAPQGTKNPNRTAQNKACPPDNPPQPKQQPTHKKPHPVTKFIPQSIYNPETGKVFGVLSTEDLLIVALILLLLDGTDDDSDNTMLIYALIYILISEYIDLPF